MHETVSSTLSIYLSIYLYLYLHHYLYLYRPLTMTLSSGLVLDIPALEIIYRERLILFRRQAD